MAIGTENDAPWDERAALEELERLKRGIEEWRQRRKEVQAEFDRFVRGFRTMPPEREILDPPAVSSAVGKTDLALGETLAADSASPAPTAPLTSLAIPPIVKDPAISPSDPDPSTAPPYSPIVTTAVNDGEPSREQRTRRTQVIAVTGGLAVVIAAGALLMRTWGGKPDGSSNASKQSAAGRATQVPRPTAPSAPTPNAVVPDAPRSEITALRHVWVRVIVDGTREVEREMQAGERIPLRAGRTTVIRAGNAGAVRVTINGEDRGTLGPEGEVVTRTLQTPTPNR
jgi:hypothetical protein